MAELADAITDSVDVERRGDGRYTCQTVCLRWASHQAADCIVRQLLEK